MEAVEVDKGTLTTTSFCFAMARAHEGDIYTAFTGLLFSVTWDEEEEAEDDDKRRLWVLRASIDNDRSRNGELMVASPSYESIEAAPNNNKPCAPSSWTSTTVVSRLTERLIDELRERIIIGDAAAEDEDEDDAFSGVKRPCNGRKTAATAADARLVKRGLLLLLVEDGIGGLVAAGDIAASPNVPFDDEDEANTGRS